MLHFHSWKEAESMKLRAHHLGCASARALHREPCDSMGPTCGRNHSDGGYQIEGLWSETVAKATSHASETAQLTHHHPYSMTIMFIPSLRASAMSLLAFLPLATVVGATGADPSPVDLSQPGSVEQEVAITRVVPFTTLQELAQDAPVQVAAEDAAAFLYATPDAVDAFGLAAYMTQQAWTVLSVEPGQPKYEYRTDSDGYPHRTCRSRSRIRLDDGAASPIQLTLLSEMDV